MRGRNCISKEMRDDPAPNTTTRYSNAQVEFKRVSRRMDRVPVAPSTRQQSYICCRENTKVMGAVRQLIIIHKRIHTGLRLPRPCPRERPGPLRRGNGSRGGSGRARESRGDPHTRSEAEVEDAHPSSPKISPAESGASPQPGWSYYHSPPSGDRRWDHGACPITGS